MNYPLDCHLKKPGAPATDRCVPDLKTLGHWKSSAYTRYIRAAPETLYEVSKKLVVERL